MLDKIFVSGWQKWYAPIIITTCFIPLLTNRYYYVSHSNPLSLSPLLLVLCSEGLSKNKTRKGFDKTVSICFLKQTYPASILFQTARMENWGLQAVLPADGSGCLSHGHKSAIQTPYWRAVLQWRVALCEDWNAYYCCHIIAILCSRDVVCWDCDNVGRPRWRKWDIPL